MMSGLKNSTFFLAAKDLIRKNYLLLSFKGDGNIKEGKVVFDCFYVLDVFGEDLPVILKVVGSDILLCELVLEGLGVADEDEVGLALGALHYSLTNMKLCQHLINFPYFLGKSRIIVLLRSS